MIELREIIDVVEPETAELETAAPQPVPRWIYGHTFLWPEIHLCNCVLDGVLRNWNGGTNAGI